MESNEQGLATRRASRSTAKRPHKAIKQTHDTPAAVTYFNGHTLRTCTASISPQDSHDAQVWPKTTHSYTTTTTAVFQEARSSYHYFIVRRCHRKERRYPINSIHCPHIHTHDWQLSTRPVPLTDQSCTGAKTLKTSLRASLCPEK